MNADQVSAETHPSDIMSVLVEIEDEILSLLPEDRSSVDIELVTNKAQEKFDGGEYNLSSERDPVREEEFKFPDEATSIRATVLPTIESDADFGNRRPALSETRPQGSTEARRPVSSETRRPAFPESRRPAPPESRRPASVESRRPSTGNQDSKWTTLEHSATVIYAKGHGNNQPQFQRPPDRLVAPQRPVNQQGTWRRPLPNDDPFPGSTPVPVPPTPSTIPTPQYNTPLKKGV